MWDSKLWMSHIKTPPKEQSNRVFGPPVSSLDLRNIKIRVYGSEERRVDASGALKVGIQTNPPRQLNKLPRRHPWISPNDLPSL